MNDNSPQILQSVLKYSSIYNVKKKKKKKFLEPFITVTNLKNHWKFLKSK